MNIDNNILSEEQYAQAISGEGEYWDNFVEERLQRGEMPGSLDYRIAFTQNRYNHGWRPFCVGVHGINLRMKEVQYILKAATQRPGMKVLDLGCGAGWLSLELARLGAHVTGVDISPTNLALGRYMAETNSRNFPFLYQGFAGLPCKLENFGSVEYVFDDLNKITLPTHEYDAVVVMDSLHHVMHAERLLEQVREALKPNGLFVGIDHTFATSKTHIFNEFMMPWLEEFYAWVTANDPTWFYDGVIALGDQHNWGAFSIDYDPTPVEGSKAFSEQLFAELLEVIQSNRSKEAKAQISHIESDSKTSVDGESPFEDVSIKRLTRLLVEEFQVHRFETICPFIQPEQHIPTYRTEKERLFQHYLSAIMIEMGENAIKRNEADGQWMIFHLGPVPQAGTPIPSIPEVEHIRQNLSAWEAFYELSERHGKLASYVSRLEEEVARKNAALRELEKSVQTRETELNEARAPKLPWKKRG